MSLEFAHRLRYKAFERFTDTGHQDKNLPITSEIDFVALYTQSLVFRFVNFIPL
jgi:hypothetical protein